MALKADCCRVLGVCLAVLTKNSVMGEGGSRLKLRKAPRMGVATYTKEKGGLL
jgi:hypothetical protein